MKRLRRIGIFVTFLLVFVLTAGAAFAASPPHIRLEETGAKDEYKITIQNWDSQAVSVQFDLIVNVEKPKYQMDWAVQGDGVYHHIEEQALEDGQTKLTFYVDRLQPISNSASASIGKLSFQKLKKAPSFTTSGYMKVLRADNLEEGEVYQDTELTLSRYRSSGGSHYSGSTYFDLPREWAEVSGGVTSVNGISCITLDMREDGRLSADVLKNLAKRKIQATLDFGSYQWLIDGAEVGDIPDSQNYYDLTLDLTRLQNVSMAAKKSDTMQFESAYDGALPFTAVLRCKAGQGGQILFLAHYHQQNGLLEYVSHQTADSGGYVAFPFRHLSRYAIVTEDLWGVLEKESQPSADSSGGSTVGSVLAGTADKNTPPIIVPPANDPVVLEDEANDPVSPEPPALDNVPEEEPESVPVSGEADSGKGIVIGAAVVGVLLCAAVIVLAIVMYRKRRGQQ